MLKRVSNNKLGPAPLPLADLTVPAAPAPGEARREILDRAAVEVSRHLAVLLNSPEAAELELTAAILVCGFIQPGTSSPYERRLTAEEILGNLRREKSPEAVDRTVALKEVEVLAELGLIAAKRGSQSYKLVSWDADGLSEAQAEILFAVAETASAWPAPVIKKNDTLRTAPPKRVDESEPEKSPPATADRERKKLLRTVASAAADLHSELSSWRNEPQTLLAEMLEALLVDSDRFRRVAGRVNFICDRGRHLMDKLAYLEHYQVVTPTQRAICESGLGLLLTDSEGFDSLKEGRAKGRRWEEIKAGARLIRAGPEVLGYTERLVRLLGMSAAVARREGGSISRLTEADEAARQFVEGVAGAGLGVLKEIERFSRGGDAIHADLQALEIWYSGVDRVVRATAGELVLEGKVDPETAEQEITKLRRDFELLRIDPIMLRLKVELLSVWFDYNVLNYMFEQPEVRATLGRGLAGAGPLLRKFGSEYLYECRRIASNLTYGLKDPEILRPARRLINDVCNDPARLRTQLTAELTAVILEAYEFLGKKPE